MGTNKVQHSPAIVLVAIIAVLGIITSLGNNTVMSWADGPYETEKYTIKDGFYVWETTTSESTRDVENLVFETVNGPITVKPQKEGNTEAEVFAVIKIKKKFWGTENSVMKAKEQTGIKVIRDKKTMVFKAEQPKSSLFRGVNVSVALDVKVPSGISLHGKTVNGDVTVEKIEAPLTLETVNGKIRTKESLGPVKASAVNGSVDIFDTQDSFAVNTVNGSATVHMVQPIQRECKMETVNGSLTLRMPQKTGINLDAGTLNGKVYIDNHAAEGKQKRNSFHGSLNGGGAKVRMNAVNGTIRIK